MTFVDVEIATSLITEAKRTKRMSFLDSLSSLGKFIVLCHALERPRKYATFFTGGTIGLFTGMSILTSLKGLLWTMEHVISMALKKTVIDKP